MGTYRVSQLICNNHKTDRCAQIIQSGFVMFCILDIIYIAALQPVVSTPLNYSVTMAEAIRQRIVDLHHAGSNIADIARSLGVHRSTVHRTLELYKSTGNVCNRNKQICHAKK